MNVFIVSVSRNLIQLKFDIVTDRYGKFEYKNYKENQLSDAEFERTITLNVNGPEIRFKTWFGLDYVHNGHTVIAKFPVKGLFFTLKIFEIIFRRCLFTLNKQFMENMFKVYVEIIT